MCFQQTHGFPNYDVSLWFSNIIFFGQPKFLNNVGIFLSTLQGDESPALQHCRSRMMDPMASSTWQVVVIGEAVRSCWVPSIVSSLRRMWEVGKDAPSNMVSRFGKPPNLGGESSKGNMGPPNFFSRKSWWRYVKVKFYSIWPERWDERCGVGGCWLESLGGLGGFAESHQSPPFLGGV